MTDKPRHQVIREMMEASGSHFMSIGFTKKTTGEPRQMTFNPRDFNEIKGTGKPNTNPNIIKIREVDKITKKVSWKSFDASLVNWVKFKGQTIIFKNEESVS